MKRHLNEQTPPPTVAAPAGAAPGATQLTDKKLGSSGKKLQARLGKIPGLEDLLGGVTNKGDAAEILAGVAEKLGGDKIAGSAALTKALALAKEDEKENTATPAVQTESTRRVEAFVRYLFE